MPKKLDIFLEEDNSNFTAAFNWVAHTYGTLIQEVAEVVEGVYFTQENPHFHGVFMYAKDPTAPDMTPQVVVANNGQSIAQFIYVIVHEFTHVMQYKAGKVPPITTVEEAEVEADAIGTYAAQLYCWERDMLLLAGMIGVVEADEKESPNDGEKVA